MTMVEPTTGHVSPLLKQATNVAVTRGEGVYLYDADGRRYLDFTSGIGVTSTGHCHPGVVAAIRKQAGKLIHGQYTTVLHGPLVQLSERLGTLMPDDIDSFFFANAGSEAVEASVRLARHATGRTNIVVFQGGFHGRTVGAASMTTSRTTFSAGQQPLMGGVFAAPYPYAYRYGWSQEETTSFCLRELDFTLASQTAPEDTAALVVEPVMGEGGYVPSPAGFLEGLRERCDRHGILLVMDEVQTGVGRTGKFWGHEHYDVAPDILLTAKGLASGMPLSVMAASDELMRAGRPGSQGGTYGGNAVACAAALATLDVVEEEGLVDRARDMGARLIGHLRRLHDEHASIGDVRGVGLMVGVEFTDADGAPDQATADAVRAGSEQRGLLLLPCGTYGNTVRFIPPLVVDEQQIDEGATKFGEAVAAVAG